MAGAWALAKSKGAAPGAALCGTLWDPYSTYYGVTAGETRSKGRSYFGFLMFSKLGVQGRSASHARENTLGF